MPTQHQANLDFISYKGFDTDTVPGLKATLKWLKIADSDELLYGEPTGDPFDRTAGEPRRNMLIHSVQYELMKYRN
jgi:hypothetical protein